jgi:hypothetical protein
MEVDGVSNELRRRFEAVLDFGQIDWSDFGTGVVILALWISGSVIRLNNGSRTHSAPFRASSTFPPMSSWRNPRDCVFCPFSCFETDRTP